MSLKHYHIADAPKPVTPYSHAVEAGGLVFVTGQIGNDPLHPDAPLADTAEGQTRQVFANLQSVLNAVGAVFSDVAFVRIFLTHFKRDYAAFNAVYNQYFTANNLPARTTIGVAELALGALVEVDFVVRRPKEA